MSSLRGRGLSVVWFDDDGDGWLDIIIQLAEVEFDDGNLSDAIRYAQGVLTQRPAERRALELLRKIYIVGGKPDMAEAVQEHLKKLPGTPSQAGTPPPK